jgi:PBSX family phage terminase large subunit
MPRVDLCEAFLPLVGGNPGTRYVLVTGGRGSGKSFAVSLCLTMLVREPGHRVLFTRYTLTSARDSIIPEFLEKVDLLGCGGEFVATTQDVRNTASGSEILFRGILTSSGNQTAKLKSLHGIDCWVLDEAEELADEETFDRIDLSVRDKRHHNMVVLVLNPCHKAHWIHRRWYTGLPPEFSGVRGAVTYIHTTYRDNRHLAAEYVRLAEDCARSNPAKHARVWRGHWADQVDGALWTWDMIDRHRVTGGDPPAMRRVVVAVDPAVTSKVTSDETGIITVGLGVDGHCYVLADRSCRAKPLEWASTAVGEYRKRGADRVVGEVNNGGDLVEQTLRNVDGNVAYLAVRASRGKLVRAEPAAALYERGRVHHVGAFPQLETEMVSYSGRASDDSPNRMDALVWALAELVAGYAGPADGMLVDDRTNQVRGGALDRPEADDDRQPAAPTW